MACGNDGELVSVQSFVRSFDDGDSTHAVAGIAIFVCCSQLRLKSFRRPIKIGIRDAPTKAFQGEQASCCVRVSPSCCIVVVDAS